jgi:hypothetical protein
MSLEMEDEEIAAAQASSHAFEIELKGRRYD